MSMKSEAYKDEKVYSPVEDKNIRVNLNNSPIWTGLRYHSTELVEAKKKHSVLFEYSIKFDGLKPIQVTNIQKIVK
jgi:hypothetical protein